MPTKRELVYITTMDDLARAVVDGKATIESVRFDACRCGGTYRPSGTPDWQNRMTCDLCGNHVSR